MEHGITTGAASGCIDAEREDDIVLAEAVAAAIGSCLAVRALSLANLSGYSHTYQRKSLEN